VAPESEALMSKASDAREFERASENLKDLQKAGKATETDVNRVKDAREKLDR